MRQVRGGYHPAKEVWQDVQGMRSEIQMSASLVRRLPWSQGHELKSSEAVRISTACQIHACRLTRHVVPDAVSVVFPLCPQTLPHVDFLLCPVHHVVLFR
jgi:hypothetical protein